MKRSWLAGLGTVILGAAVSLSASDPGVSLIGMGFIPGSAKDLSGLAGKQICQRDDTTVCIDQATLGGLGSGVTYTGFGNVFLAVPDRGPFDGRTNVPYLDRFHFAATSRSTGRPRRFPTSTPTLLDTTVPEERVATGTSSATPMRSTPRNPRETRRFDPEAVAVGILGTFFVSDEYGPVHLRVRSQRASAAADPGPGEVPARSR